MMQMEMLYYLNVDELYVLCMLCKETYAFVDSNRHLGNSTSLHFTHILNEQGFFEKRELEEKTIMLVKSHKRLSRSGINI